MFLLEPQRERRDDHRERRSGTETLDALVSDDPGFNEKPGNVPAQEEKADRECHEPPREVRETSFRLAAEDPIDPNDLRRSSTDRT